MADRCRELFDVHVWAVALHVNHVTGHEEMSRNSVFDDVHDDSEAALVTFTVFKFHDSLQFLCGCVCATSCIVLRIHTHKL